MTIADLIAWCSQRGACDDAMDWLATLDPRAPAYRAWQTCPRGEWLLWVAGRVPGVGRKDLVLAACDCAEAALRYVPEGEDRPRVAIETARRWCDGEGTIYEVCAAARAAANASKAAAYAAYAAAADAAAYAAAAASNAAANASNAVAHAREKARRRSATLVRRRIAWRTVREGLES